MVTDKQTWTVHGGPDKAVYAYPSEHYGPWQEQVGRELAPGNFGENLTTEEAGRRGPHWRRVPRRDSPGGRDAAKAAVFQARHSFRRTLDGEVISTGGKSRAFISPSWRRAIAPGDPVVCVAEDESRITVTEMFHLVLDTRVRPGRIATATRRAVASGRLEKRTGRASWDLMPRHHPRRGEGRRRRRPRLVVPDRERPLPLN